ncbi:hypothetical protein [Paenibacillus tengchongensis]|nr:hypothetical protein [Paenibacillus tengchongensis]
MNKLPQAHIFIPAARVRPTRRLAAFILEPGLESVHPVYKQQERCFFGKK